MSWGTCYSGSNNIYYTAPPLMSDGRNYTRWVPGRKIDQEIKKQMDINSNNSYRQFLISHANNIINYNQQQACNSCGCCPYFDNNENTPNTPFIFEECLEKIKPFGYEDSNLKNLYLSRERLQIANSRPITFKIS